MNITLIQKIKKLSYERVYLYTIIAFAFVMPLSRAAISFFIILLPLIWIIEGDFKRKFEQIKKVKKRVKFELFHSIWGIIVFK